MKIEIKNRWNGSVIFAHECEDNTVKLTLLKAISESADLTGANLTDANLTRADLARADLTGANLTDANLTRADLARADLTDANLTDADLTGANLTGANLTDANLTDADLTGANLTDADLTGADLTGADLTDADLTDADLTDADLTGADLTGANLTDANLTPVRDDIWSILSSAPKEVPGLISAIKEGRIDGSTYVGSCACLVGTIANIRNVNKDAIPGLSPNSSRPAERFFLGIEKGDTPETSQFSALALQWCEDWLKRMQDAFQAV